MVKKGLSGEIMQISKFFFIIAVICFVTSINPSLSYSQDTDLPLDESILEVTLTDLDEYRFKLCCLVYHKYLNGKTNATEVILTCPNVNQLNAYSTAFLETMCNEIEAKQGEVDPDSLDIEGGNQSN